MGSLVGLACGALVLLGSTVARADGGIELQARGGLLSLRGARARSDDGPAMVQAPRVDARGAFRGVGFRALGWDRRFRWGFQEHFFWSDAARFSSAPLTAGHTAEAQGFWGTNLEVFFGGQGGTRNVTFYGELRLALYLMQTRVALRSEAGGFLGDTRYLTTRGDVGPRFGMMVRLTPNTYLDTSVQVSPLGPELFGSALGVGARF